MLFIPLHRVVDTDEALLYLTCVCALVPREILASGFSFNLLAIVRMYDGTWYRPSFCGFETMLTGFLFFCSKSEHRLLGLQTV